MKNQVANITSISFIIFLLALGVYSVDRSIWIDEAMLMINIQNIDFYQVFLRLPFYFQASPAVPLLSQKAAYSLANGEIINLRIYSLIISILCLVIFLVLRPKEIKSHVWLSTLILCLYSFLYYAVEIKHYSFEFSSSLFIIMSYFALLKGDYLKGFIFSIISMLLGFSNIIPFGVCIIFIFMIKLQSKELDFRFILYFLASLFLLTVSYIYAKFLSDTQINSHEIYTSQGIILDTYRLMHAAAGAHGLTLTLVTAALLPVSLILSKKDKVLFLYSLFFVFLIITIYLLKLLSWYPAVYSRHLYWFVPFSITLSSLCMQHIVTNYKFNKMIWSTTASVFIFISIINSYKYISYSEITANQALIKEINKLCRDKSNNLIGGPLTDAIFYSYLNSVDTSCFSSKVNLQSVTQYASTLSKRFNLFINDKDNYLILTHFDLADHEHSRNTMVRQTMQSMDIKYTIFYENKNVAILYLYK